MGIILGLIVASILFAVMYLLYRAVRYAGRRVVGSQTLKSVIEADVKPSSQKLKIKLRDYFTWNVSVSPGKGTAGGNIKINFPIKSSLAIGIVCLLLAMYVGIVTQFIIPLIFLCFAIYHFRQWYRSLELVKRAVADDLAVPRPVVSEAPEVARSALPSRPPHGSGIRFREIFSDAVGLYIANLGSLTFACFFELWLTVWTFGLLGGPLFGGLCFALLRAFQRPGQKIDRMDHFVGFRIWGRLSVLYYAWSAGILLGSLLLVIPGFVFGFLTMFAIPVAMEKGVGVTGSFMESCRLVVQNPVLNLAVFICIVLCILISGLSHVGWIAGLVTYPLGLAILVSAFRAGAGVSRTEEAATNGMDNVMGSDGSEANL